MRRSDPEARSRRASDADRDHAVDILREAAVAGRLSHDSFVWRVDQALHARHDQSLAALLIDLAPPHGVITHLFDELASFGERIRAETTCPALPLPSASEPVLVVGRDPDCDFVIDDDTTSRVHAALMLYAGRWYVTDRASTNGTRVNGRRIWGTAAVRVGDRLCFGRSTCRLVRPRNVEWWG